MMNVCVIAYVGAAIHQPFLFVFLGLKDKEKATSCYQATGKRKVFCPEASLTEGNVPKR